MDMKSVSGIVGYANDIESTADFYQKLGFRLGTKDKTTVTVYLNWFWLTFRAAGSEDKDDFQAEANAENKGAGMYVAIKVDNADAFYEKVIAAGMKPSSEPRDWPWGNREFVLRDPSGYKLVFFQKK